MQLVVFDSEHLLRREELNGTDLRARVRDDLVAQAHY